MKNDIVALPNVDLVKSSNVPALLRKIRSQWQTKSLITRVHRLLEVDPSSACQRLLNAAIHDLRDKVIIAGIDIAAEAAKQNKLPPISNEEDVEVYPTAKLIDLVYHMGLLSRPEWRRVHRCYEIRRDLEHEDDEYEAGVEDCVYIFNTCIEVILSRDPIHLLRVKDVKLLIEQPGSVAPDHSLLDDYEQAPQPRQEEIMKLLLSVALDKNQSDLVQQNAFIFISQLQSRTHNQVALKLGNHLLEQIGRNSIDHRTARVANAAGIFPYLRKAARRDFFDTYFEKMKRTGYDWSSYEHHSELLSSFREFGGFTSCPETVQPKILKWLVLAYIGRPGGVTSYGNVRHVYYSNSAAPIIAEIIQENSLIVRDLLVELENDSEIKRAIDNQHVARRYERLLDMVEDV